LTGGAWYVVHSLQLVRPKRMEKETLLATLNETLREVSEKPARSEAVLIRMREELVTFEDILRHAQQRETRAGKSTKKCSRNTES
jgi:hypothetical protein